MNKLRSIIQLLTSLDEHFINRWRQDPSIGEKTMQLLVGIKENSYKTDSDALINLYGDSQKNVNYRKLKSRLKEKLLDEVLFANYDKKITSQSQKSSFKSLKHWVAAKILIDIGMRSNSVELMESILPSAIKYDRTELALIIAKELKLNYGLYMYNKSKHLKYCQQYRDLKNIFDYKENIEELYATLAMIMSTQKSISFNDKIKELEKKAKSISPEIEKIDSYYLRFYNYNVLYFISMIKRDFEGQLLISEKAIKYFDNKKGFKNFADFSFLQKKGIALLTLKQIKKSLHTFKECLNFKFKTGGIAWQSIHNYLFTCHLLEKNYDSCYEVISTVMNNPQFPKINITFRQHWYIKEAFIYILTKNNKLNPSKIGVTPLRDFRISRFLNDIPMLSKDRKGYSVTIHIIHMIFLIAENKYDLALNKILSLRQYTFRHLKSTEFSRVRTFIKMLIKIPENNYDLKIINKKTNYLYDKLIATPMDFSEQAMSIEIIPYEQLWEEVIGLLER